MILVDTNVIIPYLRTGDPKLDGLFRTLPVAICGIARAEILHGVRSSADRVRTAVVLNSFAPVAMADSIREAGWRQPASSANQRPDGSIHRCRDRNRGDL